MFLSCFVSNKVTLHVIDTKKAEDFLTRKKGRYKTRDAVAVDEELPLGTFMYPPHSADARLPPLTKHNVE